jgi:Ca-activated chloride channel family protein
MDAGNGRRRVPAAWWAAGWSREMLNGEGRPPSPALALLQTILLATLTAIAVSVVLAAATVFFASRALAAETQAVHTADAQQGTLVLRVDGDLVPVPVVRTEVTMRITGPVARVHVRQSFVSPADRWLEGVYVFPLPESAAVDGYRMRIGERIVEGELREREAAKQAYAAAREAGRRAALLEQERPNLFTASVANIAPRDAIVVEVDYQQLARWDAGTFALRFPMVVGPRYVPRAPGSSGEFAPAVAVADADRIAPPVLRPESLPAGYVHNPVSIRIELEAGAPLGALESPTHAIEVREHGDARYSASFTAETVPADRDFELRWSPRPGNAPHAIVFGERTPDATYALLMLLPPGSERRASARLSREAIFVIDTSGSMHGASIVQAREALQLALARLEPGDRFNVIEFNSRLRALFDAPRLASAANVATASAWVGRLQAEGGTEMAPALHAALDGREHPGVVRQVVFLTDGAVGNEDELLRLVTARLGDSRLFTVGIGTAPNSHFMTRAAALGRGTFTYIDNVGGVREKMTALFAKLDSPVLKGVEVEWPGAEVEAWPARVPDLYSGEPVVVAARVRGGSGMVRVRGEQNGIAWTSEVALGAADAQAGIGKRWARDKIDALADAERRAGAAEAKRAEIIAVALAHGLVTRYTSLVAVDRTPARSSSMELASAPVPTLLPDGWVADSVLGPAAPLPQTATPAGLELCTGLVALAFGALLLVTLRERREH